MKRLLALILPLVLPVTFLLAACDDGGGGSDADDDPTVETDASDDGGNADDGDNADDGANAGGDGDGVPNPCKLIPKSELTFLLDGDPGEGSGDAVDPNQRKICTYESGLILAVENADNWDATLGALRSFRPDSVQDVPGIGEAAVWQDTGGGSGQFLALSDAYFVGVTLPSGDQTVAQFIAEAMLAGL